MAWFRSSRLSARSLPDLKILAPDLQQLIKQSEVDENGLSEMDEHIKDIIKSSQKVAEVNARLNASEAKLAADIRGSDYVTQNEELKSQAQQLQEIAQQLKLDRETENEFMKRLIDIPFRRLSTLVGTHVLDATLKKRNDAIVECSRFYKGVEKYEARERNERTPDNIARLNEKRRFFAAAQEDVRAVQNRLVDGLPQLNSAYLDYATPALLTTLRCEADTYADAARAYTEIRNVLLSKRDLIQLDGDANSSHSQLIEERLAEMRRLSIVGSDSS